MASGARQLRIASALVHALTLIHAIGAIAVWVLAVYVSLGADHAEQLATTPGARQLVAWTGRWLAVFFVALGAFLATLAWGSFRSRPWSWPAALVAYAIGVLGSAFEIMAGYPNYWASLIINGAVVATLLSPSVRKHFQPPKPSGRE